MAEHPGSGYISSAGCVLIVSLAASYQSILCVACSEHDVCIYQSRDDSRQLNCYDLSSFSLPNVQRKEPLLLKSSTDLREVAPPVIMMAFLSSSGISSVVDAELVEEVEVISVVVVGVEDEEDNSTSV